MPLDFSDLIPQAGVTTKTKPENKKDLLSFDDLLPGTEEKAPPPRRRGTIDFEDLVPPRQRVVYPKVDPKILEVAKKVMAELKQRKVRPTGAEEGIASKTQPADLRLEPTVEDLEKYRTMGVKEYRSPSGKLYPLTRKPEMAKTKLFKPIQGKPPSVPYDPSEPPMGFVPSQDKRIGISEQAKRILTDPYEFGKRLPFSPAGALEQFEMLSAMERLKKNDYRKETLPPIMYGMAVPAKGISRTPELQKIADQKLVEGYILKRSQEVERGMTFGAKVLTGVSILPAWMVEFAMTGGLATLGNKSAQQAGKKLLGQYAATKIGQVGLKTAGWLSGAGVRTTAGMPHRVAEATLRRVVSQNLEKKPENWATAIAKGWGEVFIETASEEAGAAITKGLVGSLKKMPFGGKLLSQLERAWKKIHPKGTSAEFINQLFKKGGYSNFIGEVGEERLATIMHAIAKTEDFGTGEKADLLDRLYAGLSQDVRNFPVEAAVLATPAVTRFALEKAVSTPTAPKPVEPTVAPSVTTKEITPQKIQPPKPVAEGKVVFRGDIEAEKLENLKPKISTPVDVKGIFFSTTKEGAQQFADMGRPSGEKGVVGEFVVNLKNPASEATEQQLLEELGAPQEEGSNFFLYTPELADKVPEILIERGFDGIVREGSDEIIAFSAESVARPPKPVAEGKEKFKQLIKPTTKGAYFNLNEKTGQVAFLVPFTTEPGVKVDPRYQATPVNATVADLEYHFATLDKAIQKAYAKWRNKFAKEKPNKYNELINQPLTQKYLQPAKLKKQPETKITPEVSKGELTKAEFVKRHAVEILPRKKQILAKIDSALKTAPSETELKKKLSKEIPEPASTLPTNEYWEKMGKKREQIDAAVKKIKAKRIDFEIDGGAQVINTKEALQAFRKQVESLPEKEYWPRITGLKKPPVRKPVAGKKETLNELRRTEDKTIFTDGRILIKGKPPTRAKFITPESKRTKGIPKKTTDELLSTPTDPAEFSHYAIKDPATGEGASLEPVPDISEGYGAKAKAIFKTGGKFVHYDQNLFNVIRNRFPKAEYGISSSGLLVAKKGGKPVAVLMPIEGSEGVFSSKPIIKFEYKPPATEGELATPAPTITKRIQKKLRERGAKPATKRATRAELINKYKAVAGAVKTARRGGKDLFVYQGPSGRYVAAPKPPARGGYVHVTPAGKTESVTVAERLRRLTKELKSHRESRITQAAKKLEQRRQTAPENIKNVVIDVFRDWPKDVKKVGKDYWTEVLAVAKELATPYRYKALRRTLLGVFRYKKLPAPEAVGIELQDVTDALTATHETGHNIDWLLNSNSFPSSITKRFPESEGREYGFRNELKKVSQVLRPDMWERPKPYIKQHTELMADYISMYILDPDKARELAPKVTQAFESKLAEKPELLDVISRLQEARYTGPEEPAIAEHIREVFPLSKEFTPLRLIADMTKESYIKAAEELGITAARHYKVLMHRAATQAYRIDTLVPDKARQTDLVVVAEKGEKNPWTGKTRAEIEKTLTADEKKAINLFRAYQEQARQTVNKYLRGANIAEYIKFIEDYFIHAYHTPLTEKYKGAISRWAKQSPQAKKRVLPDIAKAVELGLKPRAKTLSDGLRLWAGINYRVATNRALLRILPKITNDDGVSIIQKPGDFPYWPTVDYWPIRQNYKVPLPGRGVLLFQGRVAIDPRVKPFIDAMFDRPFTSNPVRIIEGLNATWKAFELTLLSFFHHQAEFFSAVGALGPKAMPFVGGYYGKRAQAFGKKKLFGFLPARIGVLEAGKQLEKTSEFMADYLAHGGQTGYISTEGINLMERMLRGVEDYLKNIIQAKPIAGKVVWVPYVPAKAARATYSWFQHLLWDNVQRAKLVSYYNIVADGAKNSDIPIKQVKETAVKYINDNFGGQEWLNTVFRSPKTRQFWTQLMMSLDWTWSQIKTAKWPFAYGGKTVEEQARRQLMRKIGRHHWFWYLAAIAGFTIGGNYALNGKGPWKNEIGHRLNIDWTNLWRKLPWNSGAIGQSWKERGDYARRYIGLGKAGRELVRWVTSPLSAFGNKLSPVGRSIFEQGTGYNLGHDFPEAWAREDLELYEEAYARFKHLMENFKPFGLSGNNAFLAFPSRKGMTQWKAIRAYEDIFDANAVIASDGVGARITKLQRAIGKSIRTLEKEIVQACVLNNVDWEKSMRAALSNVRSKYYRKFWNAAKKQNAKDCNRFAEALVKLGVTDKGFVQSMTQRSRQLSKEAVKTGIDTFLRKQSERSK